MAVRSYLTHLCMLIASSCGSILPPRMTFVFIIVRLRTLAYARIPCYFELDPPWHYSSIQSCKSRVTHVLLEYSLFNAHPQVTLCSNKGFRARKEETSNYEYGYHRLNDQVRSLAGLAATIGRCRALQDASLNVKWSTFAGICPCRRPQIQ